MKSKETNTVLWGVEHLKKGTNTFMSKRREKMTITRTELPENSVLINRLNQYDYVDSYQGTFIDNSNTFQFIDIGRAFFLTTPTWVSKLLMLRNKIVSVFGLKTSGNRVGIEKQLEDFKFEAGERLGIFKVFSKTDDEIVLGEDDKHLNFRISLFLDRSSADQSRRELTISSTVKFNNWFGRLYFLLVKPFHKLIVPAMLKAAIRELEKTHS